MNKPNDTQTSFDDQLLQSMINQTQFKESSNVEEGFWYSFPNQKRLAFGVASQLLIADEITPQEAVKTAKEFIDHFYSEVIAPNAWKRSR